MSSPDGLPSLSSPSQSIVSSMSPFHISSNSSISDSESLERDLYFESERRAAAQVEAEDEEAGFAHAFIAPVRTHHMSLRHSQQTHAHKQTHARMKEIKAL
jgi:hypothetical protein